MKPNFLILELDPKIEIVWKVSNFKENLLYGNISEKQTFVKPILYSCDAQPDKLFISGDLTELSLIQ